MTCCTPRRSRPIVFAAVVALSAFAFVEQAIGTSFAFDARSGTAVAAVAAVAAGVALRH